MIAKSAKRLLELRLASGTLDRKLASNIWRIWQGKNNNDIYVAPRSSAGAWKVSLHPSGYCYAGLTSQHYSERLQSGLHMPPTRVFFTWQRPAPRDDKLVWSVELWFPPEPEAKADEPLPQGISIIERPPKGKMIMISIGYSCVPKGEAVTPAGVYELGYTELSTGEYVSVWSRYVALDYEAYKSYVNEQLSYLSSTSRHLHANEEQILNMKRPRLLIINDPKVDGFLRIMDVSVNVSRRPLDPQAPAPAK